MLHGGIRTCLNTALRLGKVQRNVATLVDLPAKGHREMRCFTTEEAQRFLAAAEAQRVAHEAADSDQACFAALFVVLLLTGIRPGEALALRWSDIDGGYLRVQRAATVGVGNRKLIASTKLAAAALSQLASASSAPSSSTGCARLSGG